MLFGRKITKRYRGKLQTVIEDLILPNPEMRSSGFAIGAGTREVMREIIARPRIEK